MSRCGSKSRFTPIIADVPPKATKNIWGDEPAAKPRIEPLPMWNIPAAIPKRCFTSAEIDFERRKKQLAHRLPILTAEDIARERYPYHVILLSELNEGGYQDVAKELKGILRMQEFSQNNSFTTPDKDSSSNLEDKKELLDAIVDALKYCSDAVQKNQVLIAITVRKTMAEHMIKIALSGVAQHFYRTCLELTTQLSKESSAQFRSEIKCILGYLEIERVEESDWAAKLAISHLEEARELSKGEQWIFHSKILVLKLRKPINLYGLRDDFTAVNGHSMTIHSVATLMLNEVLQAKAAYIVFTSGAKSLTDFHLEKARSYAERALMLAEELHELIAIVSARMTLGAIFLKKQEFEAALIHLKEFQRNATLHTDHEAEAIAFNMMGSCYMGLEDSLNALDCYVCQKDVADLHNIEDLSIDALQNIGQVLLAEGQLMEAELCFAEAFHGFKNLHPPPFNIISVTENCWVKSGISAGLNLWGKFASHCRRNQVRDYEDLLDWKSHRAQPRRINRIPQELSQLEDVFTSYDPQTKIPAHNIESMGAWIEDAKKHLVIGPDSLIDLQNAFRVEVEAKRTEDERRDTKQRSLRVRIQDDIRTSSSFYSSPDHSSGSTTKTGDTGYVPFNIPDYDENKYIVFESDLRPEIKKAAGTYFEGGSRWTLASAITRVDPNDGTKTRTQSVALIPAIRPKSLSHGQDEELTFQTLKIADEAWEKLETLDSDDDVIMVKISPSQDGVISQVKRKSEFERTRSISSRQAFGDKKTNVPAKVLLEQKKTQHISTHQMHLMPSLMSKANTSGGDDRMRLSSDAKSGAPSLWGTSMMHMNRLSASTEKMISRAVMPALRLDERLSSARVESNK